MRCRLVVCHAECLGLGQLQPSTTINAKGRGLVDEQATMTGFPRARPIIEGRNTQPCHPFIWIS